MNDKGSTITWRKPIESDLDSCLAVQTAHIGVELTGAETARGVWSDLLRHPGFVAAVFECHPPINGQRIVGFGASVFVSAEFADAELAHPRPGLNARIIASVHAGRPVLLTAGEIARGNSASGLDVATLYGSWLPSLLNPWENAQVMTLLPVSLGILHAGYRVNRFFGEAVGDNEIEFMRGSGVAREIGTFPEANRVLNLVSPKEAFAQPASVLRTVFSYREPTLGLSAGEQELLSAALDGPTDTELAASLRLTMPAVKARWRTIFGRFAQMEPALAPEFFGQGGRGPQKRHRVLAWLRAHPEELRPFAPAPRD